MDVKNLQGKLSLNANISTQGIKLSQLKQNLNGKTTLSLQDGIVKGFDLEYEINKLDARIKQKAEPAKPSPLQTKFTSLGASAIIKKGVVHNKDLTAATPFTRIIGQGKVDLVKETLAYVATVKLTNSRGVVNKTSFAKLNSVPLDVHVKGTFDNPKIKPDFDKALKKLLKRSLGKQEKKLKVKMNKEKIKLKAKIKKEEGKLKEKLKKDLEKKLGNDLKKLFKL